MTNRCRTRSGAGSTTPSCSAPRRSSSGGRRGSRPSAGPGSAGRSACCSGRWARPTTPSSSTTPSRRRSPRPPTSSSSAFYPASFVALVLLLRARVAHLEPLAWVDGLIGALAVAGVAAALIFPPALEALGGSPLGVAVSLAYPCMDLVLLGLLSGAVAASKWRIGGTWLLIAVALLLFGACDVVYLSVGGQSTIALNIASVGWPFAFLLLALASWLPASEFSASAAPADGRRIVAPIADGAGRRLPAGGRQLRHDRGARRRPRRRLPRSRSSSAWSSPSTRTAGCSRRAGRRR